ncbi:MAG: MarR family transcriptional regulator [bacterium]
MDKNDPTSKLMLNILAVAGIIREKIIEKNPESSILELKTLGIVSKNENISMKTLAEYLHISSPSTTEIINKLEKNGKLKRTPSKTDRRIVSLKITSLGKKNLEKCLKQASVKIEKLFDAFTQKQKKDFEGILETIITNKKQDELTA